jgi:hypothetical protein
MVSRSTSVSYDDATGNMYYAQYTFQALHKLDGVGSGAIYEIHVATRVQDLRVNHDEYWDQSWQYERCKSDNASKCFWHRFYDGCILLTATHLIFSAYTLLARSVGPEKNCTIELYVQHSDISCLKPLKGLNRWLFDEVFSVRRDTWCPVTRGKLPEMVRGTILNETAEDALNVSYQNSITDHEKFHSGNLVKSQN